MDKLTTIKIKYEDETYSDEIPVSVLAENVEWDATHTLVDILGSIDVDTTGSIQDQISRLFNEKVSATQLQDYVAAQLNDINVNPVGSAVVVDSSLTISGAAADAQVTGDLINSLNYYTGNHPLKITNLYYYKLNGTTVEGPLQGTAINKCCEIECVAGDMFYVDGKGGDMTRVWAFTDQNGTILSVSASNASVKGIVIAPANATHFYSNNSIGQTYYVSKGNSFPIFQTVDLLNYKTSKKYFSLVADTDFNSVGAIYWDNGTVKADASTWRYTDYINISAYDILYVTMETYATSLNGNVGMAFYNAEKEYLSGVSCNKTGENSSELVFIRVPENACYARFCNRNNNLKNVIIANGELPKNTENIENLLIDVENIKQSIFAYHNLPNFDLTLAGAPKYTNGSIFETSSYRYNDYYDLSEYSHLKLSVPILKTASSQAGVAFYDSSKNFLSGIAFPVKTGTDNLITEINIDIPENATYIRTGFRAPQISDFYILGKRKQLFDAEAAYNELNEKIDVISPPTPVLFDISMPEQPSGIGIDNKIIINPVIDIADINIAVKITISSTDSIAFLGSLDLRGAQHASHVQYDFKDKKIKIYAKGTGLEIPSTMLYEADFTSIYDDNNNEYILKIGRENRDLYAGITNPQTGQTIKHTVLETVDNGYKYPCGWLEDRLTYGIIDGSITFNRISAITKVSPFCVFIGDSITEGYGIAYENSWSYKTANLFGNCLCMGRSGAQIDQSILQVTDIVSKIKPKYVVVEIGTNGGNTTAKLETLVQEIKNTGAIPILCHIPMTTNTSNTITINNMIDNLNTLVVHFDNATAIENNPTNGQNTALFQSDNLHPNINGADKMYNQFIEEMGWIKV